MTEEDDQIVRVAEMILSYLLTHPEAADTARGIERWWLRRQPLDGTAELVEKVLEALLREGLVARSVTRSGSTINRRSCTSVPAANKRKNETWH
jgi:hypothetical protein